MLYHLTAKSPITRRKATSKRTQSEGCHCRHQQASACTGSTTSPAVVSPALQTEPCQMRVDPCGVSRPLRGLPSTRNCLDKGCRSEGSRALHSLPPFEAKHPTDGSFVTAQSANASGICPLPSLNHCGFFHLHKQGKQSP